MASLELNERGGEYQEVPQNEGDKPPAYGRLFPDMKSLKNLKDSDKSPIKKATDLFSILCSSCNFNHFSTCFKELIFTIIFCLKVFLQYFSEFSQ